MTAFPAVPGDFPSPRGAAGPRPLDTDTAEDGLSLLALVLAVPAALDATMLWWGMQGGTVWQLALVYAVSGNLTYRLALAGLTRLEALRRPAP